MKPSTQTKYFFIALICSVCAFFVAPHEGFTQQKIFEVFGGNNGEFFGSSIMCRNPGVHVGVPGFLRSTINNVGIVRVYDPATEALLYSINYPITPSTAHLFGHAMMSVPDSNNNSIPEIAISAPGSFSPAVFIFDEGSAGSTAAIRTFFGQTSDAYGTDLALLDYPPRDGVAELVVAAPARTPIGSGSGEVEFVEVTTGNVLDTIPSPGTSYQDFGRSIARMADIDNNGSDEIAIGAPDSFSESGAVLIYTLIGPGSGPTFQLLTEIQGANPGERFGQKLASVPDITGDGKDELVVAAPDAINSRGIVRVYSGASLTAANPVSICQITGSTDGDSLGASLVGLGDVDGDGRGEFAVGVPGFANGQGQVQVFQFNSGNGCQLIRTYNGTATTDEFGRSIFAQSCPVIAQKVTTLMVGTTSDQGGIDAGSAIVFSAPPTVTPTPTPTPTTTPTPTSTPTPNAKPSNASLTFRISEAGEFKIITKYDQEPDDSCSSILYGRINVGSTVLNLEKLVSTTNSTANTNERETVVRILNFPRAAKVDGKKPIINMGLRTTCDGTTFDSNVFARYMNCGVPDTAVSLDEWMNTLKQALGRAGEQTSVRSDRNVKVVRLKKRRHKR